MALRAEDRTDAEDSDVPDPDSAASDGLVRKTPVSRKSVEIGSDDFQNVYPSGPGFIDKEVMTISEQEELDAAEGSLGEEDEETPFELNIFEQIAMELEQEWKVPPRGPKHRSGPTSSPREQSHWTVDSDEDDWAVRDGVASPDRLLANSKGQTKAFKFAAQQADAAQVSWESQSLAPIPDSMKTPKVKPSPSMRLSASTQVTPRSIVRSPRSDVRARIEDPIETPASASRLQHVSGSPQTPSTPQRHVFLPRPSDISTLPPMPRVSLNPAAELIAIRAASKLPPFGRSLSSEGADEGADLLEDEDLADILPNTAQLNGHVPQISSDVLQTPQNANLADLLPDDMLLEGDHSILTVNESESNLGLDVDLISQSDGFVVASDTGSVSGFPMSVEQDLDPAGDISGLEAEDRAFSSDRYPSHKRAVTSTARQVIPSSRPRHKSDAQTFASPDPDEDQEDRQLLHSSETRRLNGRRMSLTAESLTPSVHRSPHTPDLHRLDPPRISGRSINRAYEITGQDEYLIDGDGRPLEVDPTYIAPRHVAQSSSIHGKIEGQSTPYSRLSGRRKWTKAEEILLYRTVQKVPLTEEYVLRVVWHLHGEYGKLSNTLEQFNPQHMKDKMRVIVDARVNQRRPVIGRARFFLRNHHIGKAEFIKEIEEIKSSQRSNVRRTQPPKKRANKPRKSETDDSEFQGDELDSDTDFAPGPSEPRGAKQTEGSSQSANNQVGEEVRGHVSTLSVTASSHD